ncbi:hypothetical protein DBR06_SOUSAS13110016 [Sousa chinensis]|nr:hypothetical protein DBR06_SOUSAS13110016 [Sousa chinensis]
MKHCSPQHWLAGLAVQAQNLLLTRSCFLRTLLKSPRKGATLLLSPCLYPDTPFAPLLQDLFLPKQKLEWPKNSSLKESKSGMLEAGVDRIISQVVDPKLNHIFRPQIERAIHEFLAAQKKEAVPAPPPEPESQDPPAPSQDAS